MTTVTLPKLGEMTESAILIEWMVQVGDHVEEGAPLASVDTDKVEADVPSPIAGVVAELLAEPDDEIAVGDALCVLSPRGAQWP